MFSRLRAIAAAPNNPRAVKLHWELAAAVVDEERPGDFNQALMELGATLCTRSAPTCGICPVRSLCWAYARRLPPRVHADLEDFCEVCAADAADNNDDDVTQYPLTTIRAKSRLESTKVCCVESAEGFLLVKRHDKIRVC